ncbi:DegT/DnrJ/EryC1/StrS aminotransferase [Desulfarculus baarsii DSM 2075]|uniref:DegT/DnrJ/EryC1/StrS aminotransferase n=1 Tax=Desulfarculus baarsii (strain ATCC 33931 / DSM 2075 / LMG 7858 / VKM B-1802 / 2st14) TaxID=644282 RepID=E1QIZ3_DESB2|nr:aminotransferase class I/II-fold pyridoxal phosphate-dependent enzyme [Desulfarculus baarsii]ADK85536.1 DegT/DnrJ/EryC1/StrS aminotransferase [Desulfarculus baarsii DSM 2075]
MKTRASDLAILGGQPTFAQPLHVGQLNLPDWPRFQQAFEELFRRRWFTNHGPLVRQLEQRLAEFLDVRHVVCMTNGTLALMVALQALDLRGRVIAPAFTFPATVQALTWAGLEPLFCDVDEKRHVITADLARPLIEDGVSAILGVHLWGRPCDPEALADLAQRHGLALLFDAAHAFGCAHNGRLIGGLGRVEIFSFHATKVLNAAEGGCATTDDDEMAARLRTVRNFHNQETFARVGARINAKMSEAQAAMALLSLEDYPRNAQANQRALDAYAHGLAGLPGLELLDPNLPQAHNRQFVVLDVDAQQAGLSRDELTAALEAENVLARRYFMPGIHRSPPYNRLYPHFVEGLPVTDRLSARLMQLPSGQAVAEHDIATVCALTRTILEHAPQVSRRLRAYQAKGCERP